MATPSTYSYANWPFKTGLDIGWHPPASSCRVKIDGILQIHNPKISHKFVVFLGLSITTNACGLNVLAFLHHSPASWGNRPFVGLLKLTLLSKTWKCSWNKIASLHIQTTKTFHIYTDASNYQVGAYIVQDNKPVAFLPRKPKDTQLKYTVGDKELFSIIMVLTEFHTMLFSAMIHIHTNHLNITTNNTTPDLIICCLNYVEQFNPNIYFIPGKDNVIADTRSWLDCLEESVLFKEKQVFVLKDSVSKGMDFANDPLLIKSFIHLPPLEVRDTNPTNYQWIFTKPNETDILVKPCQKFPDRYFNKILDDKGIIWHEVFALTDSMIWPTIHWFHAMLWHSGSCCMHTMLQAWYHHPHLCMHIECMWQMSMCQALWPQPWSTPWLEFFWCSLGGSYIDLINPWLASTPHVIVELFALTCIYTTTNIVKIAWIFNKSSNHVATCFEHNWLL